MTNDMLRRLFSYHPDDWEETAPGILEPTAKKKAEIADALCEAERAAEALGSPTWTVPAGEPTSLKDWPQSRRSEYWLWEGDKLMLPDEDGRPDYAEPEIEIRPGMILRLAEGGGREVLIGDTNKNGGRCSCCKDVRAKVLGYRWAGIPGWSE